MKKIPFRIKYFLSHLLISLCVAGISLFLIFKIWYPAPLHIALGIGGLVVMMLAIDVILGPLLTLVLAKKGKKGLKMDLVVIGFIQLSALLYGLYSIEKGRPVAIAFDVNRFEVVQKHMIQDNKGMSLLRVFKDNQKVSIPIVAVRPAKDEIELAQRMENELLQGIMSSANPELYQTVAENFHIIQESMRPISELPKFNEISVVEQTMIKYPQADGFLPIVGSAKNLVVLLDGNNKSFVAVVNIRPW